MALKRRIDRWLAAVGAAAIVEVVGADDAPGERYGRGETEDLAEDLLSDTEPGTTRVVGLRARGADGAELAIKSVRVTKAAVALPPRMPEPLPLANGTEAGVVELMAGHTRWFGELVVGVIQRTQEQETRRTELLMSRLEAIEQSDEKRRREYEEIASRREEIDVRRAKVESKVRESAETQRLLVQMFGPTLARSSALSAAAKWLSGLDLPIEHLADLDDATLESLRGPVAERLANVGAFRDLLKEIQAQHATANGVPQNGATK